MLENYVLLLSFCILLCSNTNTASYSKSSNYKFYIELILFTIKSMFLLIKHNKYDNLCIQILKFLLNLISFYIEQNPKNNYFLMFFKHEKKETGFKILSMILKNIIKVIIIMILSKILFKKIKML